jgi:hypothetical protein
MSGNRAGHRTVYENAQNFGGLNPIRAQRSSNSACRLRTTGAAKCNMIGFVAWQHTYFKKFLFPLYIVGVALPPVERVDRFREANIPRCNPARIMGGERDIDLIINIRPFGMVIRLLRQQRHMRHEREGFHEGFELEGLMDRFFVRRQQPGAR